MRPFRALAPLLLVSVALLAAPASSWASAPSLAVDAAADQHPISPYIYGMNFADSTLASQIDLPVDRWGGNRAEMYNWQLGSTNTASDWYFENLADCFPSCSGPYVPGYRGFVAGDRSVGAKTLLQLPMAGYVAKDAPTSHPLTCGFPKTLFPVQDAFDPWDPNCGNGKQGGSWLAPVPTNVGQAEDQSYAAAWIDDLKGRYGSAANGGVGFYELGNEPALWNETHHDIHPTPVSYDELWSGTQAYGAAVKAADPSARVLGPSEWGWPNYFCSAQDRESPGYCSSSSPDRAAHGGTPLAEWLLQRAAAYQASHGTRILDYLDLHYYPQGSYGGAGEPAPTEVTRSLWDPTYTDPSWIGDTIDLIPRMRAWVASDYPGNRISLSEYDLTLATGDPTLKALIEADTLGIFAREGLDLATMWNAPAAGSAVADAFRIYRDYDGAHSKFGDTWVRSTSSDQTRLAAYGAVRSSDGALTLLVINKTAAAITAPLALSNAVPAGAAQVWRWSGGGISRLADESLAGGGSTATYPAESLTLLVVPLASPAPGGGGSGGSPPASVPPTGPVAVAPPGAQGEPPPAGGSASAPGGSTATIGCVAPRVVGLRLRAATRAIARAHCLRGRLRRVSSSRTKGRVVGQSPRPGKRPSHGAKVDLAVSRGPRRAR